MVEGGIATVCVANFPCAPRDSYDSSGVYRVWCPIKDEAFVWMFLFLCFDGLLLIPTIWSSKIWRADSSLFHFINILALVHCSRSILPTLSLIYTCLIVQKYRSEILHSGTLGSPHTSKKKGGGDCKPNRTEPHPDPVGTGWCHR